MSNSNGKDDPIKTMQDDIRDIRNDIEKIKSDTHNLNRITTVANTQTIINDLKKIVGTSLIRAAIIHLTKDEISAQDLASQLGISSFNIPKNIDPLTDKAYISELKKGTRRYYKRVETIDLINFESVPEFKTMLETWRKKKGEKTQTAPVESTTQSEPITEPKME